MTRKQLFGAVPQISADTAGRDSVPVPQDLDSATVSWDRHILGATPKPPLINDRCLAAVCGSIQWRTPELNAIANDAGAAEALSRGFARYGEKVLDHMAGHFACAVLERASRRLFLAIDRIGVFSLYYTSDNRDAFAFGTHAHLLEGYHDAAISEQAIFDYLYFHMIPSPRTLFKGVRKLGPGQYLLYDGNKGSTRVDNYWHPTFQEQTREPLDALSSRMLDELEQAVRRAVPETGNTGAFLSGGLDSSSVAGMLVRSVKNAPTFSVGFDAKGYDETGYARIAADFFGNEKHEYYVTPEDVVEAVPRISAAFDEPFGNSSALPAYFCAKMAREHGIDRLLAGDGGDEIFAGNERYLKQKVFELYFHLPGFLRKGLIEPLLKNMPAVSRIPPARKLKSYVDQANLRLPDRLQSYNFLHRHAAAELFEESFLEQVATDEPIDALRQRYREPEAGTSDVNRMLYLDWKFTLADNDLRKVCGMCEFAGVDVAFPMLDDAFIAFSTTIPSALKLKQGKLRHFYRQAVRDFLPAEILNKSKHGFGLPFGVWMSSHKALQEMAYGRLLDLKKRPYFKKAFIDEAIRLHRTGHASYYGELVWILMVLESWLSSHDH